MKARKIFFKAVSLAAILTVTITGVPMTPSFAADNTAAQPTEQGSIVPVVSLEQVQAGQKDAVEPPPSTQAPLPQAVNASPLSTATTAETSLTPLPPADKPYYHTPEADTQYSYFNDTDARKNYLVNKQTGVKVEIPIPAGDYYYQRVDPNHLEVDGKVYLMLPHRMGGQYTKYKVYDTQAGTWQDITLYDYGVAAKDPICLAGFKAPVQGLYDNKLFAVTESVPGKGTQLIVAENKAGGAILKQINVPYDVTMHGGKLAEMGGKVYYLYTMWVTESYTHAPYNSTTELAMKMEVWPATGTPERLNPIAGEPTVILPAELQGATLLIDNVQSVGGKRQIYYYENRNNAVLFVYDPATNTVLAGQTVQSGAIYRGTDPEGKVAFFSGGMNDTYIISLVPDYVPTYKPNILLTPVPPGASGSMGGLKTLEWQSPNLFIGTLNSGAKYYFTVTYDGAAHWINVTFSKDPPAVPTGWTRTVSNANYAYKKSYVASASGMKYVISLKDLTTGQERGVHGYDSVYGDVVSVDVAPDGRHVSYLWHGTNVFPNTDTMIFKRLQDLGKVDGNYGLAPKIEVNVTGLALKKVTYTDLYTAVIGGVKTADLKPLWPMSVPAGWTLSQNNPSFAYILPSSRIEIVNGISARVVFEKGKVMDLRTGKVVYEFLHLYGTAVADKACEISPDGKYVLISYLGYDGDALVLYDIAKKKETVVASGMYDIKFSFTQNGKVLWDSAGAIVSESVLRFYNEYTLATKTNRLLTVRLLKQGADFKYDPATGFVTLVGYKTPSYAMYVFDASKGFDNMRIIDYYYYYGNGLVLEEAPNQLSWHVTSKGHKILMFATPYLYWTEKGVDKAGPAVVFKDYSTTPPRQLIIAGELQDIKYEGNRAYVTVTVYGGATKSYIVNLLTMTMSVTGKIRRSQLHS